MILLLACTRGDVQPVDSEGPDEEVLPHGFESEGVVPCEAPVELGWRLADSGFEGGPDTTREWESGALVHDLDGDGDLDLMVPFLQPGSTPRTDVYWNQDGWVREELLGAGALGLVDTDGDGELEVTFTAPMQVWDEGQLDRLDLQVRARDIVWMDLDEDGQPELIVGTPDGQPDQVLRSDLTPWFLLEASNAFDLVPFDADGDGDLDLYVVSDLGLEFGPNRLYVREGASLLDQGSDANVVVDGMSADPGDYDNDGDEDLLLGNAAHNQILQNDTGWIDVTAALDADALTGAPDMAWNAVWLDADNDGLLDILVARGDALPSEPFDGTLVLQRQSEGFTPLHLGLGSYRSVVPADFNGDGVLDWLATQATAAPELWLSDGCTAPGWLMVEAPVGTVVEVGEQRRVVRTDSGQGAAGPPRVHIGLGQQETVDVRILLPDGTYSEGRRVQARQALRYAE